MRIGLLLILVVVAACSERKNPNVCCATEAQCADVGFDELTPCGVGQACTDDNTCVAAECQVNADCSSAAPICR
ncbi:MAG: hypothetical protein ACKV2T_38500 [Kofleriaceae bacterium]